MTQTRGYRVLYFRGDELDLSTKMVSGRAFVRDNRLQIEGASPISIPLPEIRDTSLYRLHGLGRMIRFRCGADQFFVTVVRLNFFGYFAIINFFATSKLFRELLADSEPC